MIIWNKVTWYSKLGALILFVAVVPLFSFWVGMKYEQEKTGPDMDQLTEELNTIASKKLYDFYYQQTHWNPPPRQKPKYVPTFNGDPEI